MNWKIPDTVDETIAVLTKIIDIANKLQTEVTKSIE